MRLKSLLAGLASLALLGDIAPRITSAQQQSRSADARPLLRRALAAVGGEEALAAIEGTTATIWISRLNLGAAQWPGAPGGMLQLAGTEARDFRGERIAIAGQRHAVAGTVNPVRMVATAQGGFERTFGYTVPYTDDTLAHRRRELHLAPLRVLLTANRGRCRVGPTITQEVSGRRLRSLSCFAPETGDFTLRLDSVWAWPVEVERIDDSHIFGQQRVVSRYGAFNTVAAPRGRVLVPHVVHQSRDGRLESVTSYSGITAGAPHDSLFALPNELRREVYARAPIVVTVEEVAPGVNYLGSDSVYYALAVIQRDSIIMLEAAETQNRMGAMLDTLARRFPRTPVRLVVSSHHHSDHMAGLPTAFTRDIRVATHPDNVTWVRRLAAVSAQRSSRGARAPQILTIADSLVTGRDTDNELRLYAVSLSEAATHIIGVLPKHGILFVADAGDGDIGPDLRGEIERRGFRIRRIATTHSGMQDWPTASATP